MAPSLLEFKKHFDNVIRYVVRFLGSSVWSQKLDLMIFVGSFQLRIFYSSVVLTFKIIYSNSLEEKRVKKSLLPNVSIPFYVSLILLLLIFDLRDDVFSSEPLPSFLHTKENK